LPVPGFFGKAQELTLAMEGYSDASAMPSRTVRPACMKLPGPSVIVGKEACQIMGP